MQREQREITGKSDNVLARSLRQFWGVMREMSRMLDTVHGLDTRPGAYLGEWEPTLTRMPAGDDLVMYFELPDVEAEDFELHLDGRFLVVSGVKRELPSLDNATVEDVASGSPRFGTVRYRPFRRAVELPRDVGARELEAVFGAGLLQVRAAGAAENGSRRIHLRDGRRPLK